MICLPMFTLSPINQHDGCGSHEVVVVYHGLQVLINVVVKSCLFVMSGWYAMLGEVESSYLVIIEAFGVS